MFMKKKYSVYQQFYVTYVVDWNSKLEYHNDQFGLHSTIEKHEEGLTDGEVAEALTKIAIGLYESQAKNVTLLNWWIM